MVAKGLVLPRLDLTGVLKLLFNLQFFGLGEQEEEEEKKEGNKKTKTEQCQ